MPLEAVKPSTDGSAIGPIYNGPAAAAILGASFAVFVLGILFTVSHSSSSLSNWLVFRQDAGAVSGLSTTAIIVWLATWGVLTPLLWKRNVPFVWLVAISGVLLALGLLLTTPPIVQRIEL